MRFGKEGEVFLTFIFNPLDCLKCLPCDSKEDIWEVRIIKVENGENELTFIEHSLFLMHYVFEIYVSTFLLSTTLQGKY